MFLKRLRRSCRCTIYACYLGYITQAIVNNFGPLLFLTFSRSYSLGLAKVGLLTTLNFGVQLAVDLISAGFIDRIGYRAGAIAAHVFAAAGLILLGVLPKVLSDPFTGLAVAVVIYAVGGGLTEVLISPIVEACPTDDKASAMSLLHSFYCWGTVLVVAVSTLAFYLFGIGSWPWIGAAWALLPAANALVFTQVPINTLTEEGEGLSLRELFSLKLFYILLLLMMAAGASEQAMSQWASAFAEAGLNVSKTAGDLAGPCFFSILMGSARVLHAKIGEKTDLYNYLGGCGILCIAAYLLASLAPSPVLSLLGCGLCGFSVGAMWPGVFSLGAKECRQGGTALFALLALAGDLGCSAGPTTVGFVSGALGDDLKRGVLAGVIFPVLLLLGLALLKKWGQNTAGSRNQKDR